MSQDVEWFEGHSVDQDPKTILPLPFWAALIAVALVLLQGCATPQPESRVCFMGMMGRTDGGLSVVKTLCMTEEQFAESQK